MTCELSLQTTGKESSLVQMVNNSLNLIIYYYILFSDIYCSVIYFLCFESTIRHVSVCTLPMWASHRKKFVVCRVPVIIMVKRAPFPSYGHLEFFIFLTLLAG